MDSEQRNRFADAVERKKAEADERSRRSGDPGRGTESQDPSGVPAADAQAPIVEAGRPQDVASPRDKNAGKGKKTADKWNQ